MKPIKFLLLLILLCGSLILGGCANNQAGPAQAIEGYFQALANKDKDKLVNLSCNAWEENALVELDSLAGVTAELNEMSCQESGKEGEDSLVNCNGSLELNYDGEIQALDLSGRVLVARYEDGEWRACGYK